MSARCPVGSRLDGAAVTGGIREIAARAEALEREDRNVIHLEIGRPDYDSPLCAKRAAARALEEGRVHYTENAGLPELRRAIAEDRSRRYGTDVDANAVVVTAGATEALAAVFLTLLSPGDEVIVPAPFYPAYALQIALAGGVVREIPCRFEDGFRIDPAALEAAVTPRTKMLLLNSPNNPAGTVLGRTELAAAAEVARRRDLWVLSDECYERFLYEEEPLTVSALPGMAERTIVVSAASKTFSMTGWRIGWLLLPPEVRPIVNRCHQHLTSCAVSFAQVGAAEALRSAEEDVRRMIEGYRERRDVFVEELRRVEGFELLVPQGAFYVFPSVGRLTEAWGMTAMELAAWLLEEAGVAVVAGDPFRAPGDFLRMAFSRPVDELREAAWRIERAVRNRWRVVPDGAGRKV